GGKAYPVSLRALSFEQMYPMRDRHYCLPAARTFAKELSERFLHTLEEAAAGAGGAEEGAVPADALAVYEHRAIEALRDNVDLMRKVRSNGVAWGALKAFLSNHLPETVDDRDELAFRLVPKALDE